MAAFSGGADSTALLAAAAAVAPALDVRLYAVWVDHGIRPVEERRRERDFIRSFTRELGVPCRFVDPPEEPLEEQAARNGTGVEAAARDFRYAALADAAARFGCARILTAHTRDDQVETLLQRILTGSGAAGLRGIPEDRPPFCRPFLGLPKAALLRYLRSRSLEWREDSTNAGEAYLRNRVRRRLIPAIEGIFPGFRRGLAAMSEKLRLDEDLLAALAARDLPAARSEGESSFDQEAFRTAHPALRIRALTEEAGRLAGKGRRVPYALIRAAALAEPRPGARGEERILAEGMGLRFLERAGRVRVVLSSEGDGWNLRGPAAAGGRPDVTFGAGYAFLFERPGSLRIETGGSCTLYFREGARGPARGTFEFPLTVRSRRPGDSIAIPGGEKPLDEILSDMALSKPERDFVPVLEDRRGIVAVLGSLLGGRDRYRHNPGVSDPPPLRLGVEMTGIGPFRRIERSAEAP